MEAASIFFLVVGFDLFFFPWQVLPARQYQGHLRGKAGGRHRAVARLKQVGAQGLGFGVMV
jgi:hypothetical protein